MNVDVAIVGGGLAGSAAAITLARQRPGARVVLLEQKSYPSDKLCGEFLSPECGPLLARLGVLQTIDELRPAEYRRVRATGTGAQAWEADLPGMAYGISRRALDACLFQAAGMQAEAWSGTHVRGLTGDLRRGFELAVRRTGELSQIRARCVIGAHGKRSSVDRLLRRRFVGRRQPFMALKAHFDGPRRGPVVELHAFPGGYCGINDVEGGQVNVCLLVQRSVFLRAGGTAESLVTWMRSRQPHLDDFFSRARRLQPWLSLAEIAFEGKPAVDSDVLMAGDSAGMICPLAGNGQAMALQSGEMVAGFVAQMLDEPSQAPRGAAAYAQAWRRRFGARMAVGRALQALMLSPAGLRLALQTIAAWPAVGRFIVASTREPAG